jgi:alpha-tubulin suppressor-like RCC1 family protein
MNKLIATLMVGAALGAAPSVLAAGPGPAVDEWGKPVASGGPGSTPTQDQSFAGLVTIDAGNQSDVAVLSDGTVWGWGATRVSSPSMTAVQIPGVRDVSQRPEDGAYDYAAVEQPGTDSACPASSTVVSWGLNALGDLGIGVKTKENFASGQVITALQCQDVVQIAAAAHHMIALTAGGDIYVWGGDNALGLGLNTKSQASPVLNTAATALTGGSSAGVLVTAGSGTEGMLVDGQAYCWGANQEDQCGTGHSEGQRNSPTAVDQGSLSFTWIDQGGNFGYNGHTLAIASDGNIWAWGDGAEGQLGQGTTVSHDTPVAISFPSGVSIVDVRAGGMHSLALSSTGEVYAWGDNAYGQVGNGTHTNQLTPAVVLSGVSQISAGSLHSLAA